MKIDKILSNQELIIILDGRLDTNTSAYLDNEIQNLYNIKTLILDLEKLEYISSAGLRILLNLQKIMEKQGSMIIRNVKENIKKIFDITGFTDLFTFE